MSKQERPDWTQYFMTMAYLAASRSTDQSTHAGSVIVTKDNSIISTGYNGPPRGIEFSHGDPRHKAPEKYKWMEHSERNAIYNAARHGSALDGCRLYVNFCPCVDCARAMIQSGIDEVIVHHEGQETFLKSRGGTSNWDESFATTKEILGDKLRFWSGKLYQPIGFFSGSSYKL